MNDYASDGAGSEHRGSELADVSSLSLAELLSSDESVLANALRHVLDEVDRSAEAISGWSSYID